MKWNILVGSMVLGLGLCTQSFGFDLLDRMLGINGCGCDAPAKSCCAAGPSCGADNGCAAKPSCASRCCSKKCDPCATKRCCHRTRCDKGCNKGCTTGCANKGCAAPAPSCAAPAPTCAAPAPTCAAPAPTCAAAAPSCGCDAKKSCNSCNKGCRQICRPGLLDRLFDCNKCSKPSCTKGCANKGCAAPAPTCAAPACGCDGHAAPAAVKEGGDQAPQPPAPVVDPSAYLQTTQRRVVQASTSLVR